MAYGLNRHRPGFSHSRNTVLGKYYHNPKTNITPLAIGYRTARSGYQAHPLLSATELSLARQNIFSVPSIRRQGGQPVEDAIAFVFDIIRESQRQDHTLVTPEDVLKFAGLDDSIGSAHFATTFIQMQQNLTNAIDLFDADPDQFMSLKGADVKALFPNRAPVATLKPTDLAISRIASPSVSLQHGTQHTVRNVGLLEELNRPAETRPNLMFFDTEWLGGPRDDFTAITEIAMRNASGEQAHLLGLTDKAALTLRGIHESLSDGLGITADQRRYMIDLIGYSTLESPFEGGSSAQFAPGQILAHADWTGKIRPTEDLKHYSAHIESGLENLQTYGVKPTSEDGTKLIEGFIDDLSRSDFAVSYNALGGDVAALTAYLEELGETSTTLTKSTTEMISTLKQKSKHLDMYGVIANLYRNEQEQLWMDLLDVKHISPEIYSAIQEVSGLEQPGYLQQEVINILVQAAEDPKLKSDPVQAIKGVQQQQAHRALVDIDILERISTSKKVNDVIKNRMSLSRPLSKDLIKQGPDRFLPQTSFYASEDPMQVGDYYYWHDGSTPDTGIITAFDIDEKGRFMLLEDSADHGFKRGQHYQFQGFYEHEGYKSARFYDPATNRTHFASFKDEMDLAAYLHNQTVFFADQNILDNAFDPTALADLSGDAIKELMEQAEFFREDSARRSYSRMFEGDPGGFWRAKHFYSKAKSGLDFGSMTIDEVAKSLSWSEDVQVNRGFAQGFLEMLPRLEQEADVFLPIINNIEQMMEAQGAGLTPYQQRQISSEALMRAKALMYEQLDISPEEVMTNRKRPSFRRYGVQLTDPFTGDINTIELRGAKRDPQSALRGYVSRTAKSYSKLPHKEQAARRFAIEDTLSQLEEMAILTPREAKRIREMNQFGPQIDALASILGDKITSKDQYKYLLTLPDLEYESIAPLTQSLQERILAQGLDLNTFTKKISHEAFQDVRGAYSHHYSKERTYFFDKAKEWLNQADANVTRHMPDSVKMHRQDRALETSVDSFYRRFQSKDMGISSALVIQDVDGVQTPIIFAGKTDSIDAGIRAIMRNDLDAARGFGAIFELPELSLDGRMVGGRINQVTVGISDNGILWAESLFESAMRQLNQRTYRLRQSVAAGDYAQAEALFRSYRRKALEPISASKLRPSESMKDFMFNTMDNFTDVQKLLHYQVDDSLVDYIRKQNDLTTDEYGLFTDQMIIQSELKKFLEGKGIAVDTSYVKHGWLGRYRYGFEDASVRKLFPYGSQLDASRPAYRQFGNFNAITQAGKDFLLDQDGFIKDDRFLPGTMAVTKNRMMYEQRYFDNDIMPGVTMRYAHMSDADLQHIVAQMPEDVQAQVRKAFGENLELLTTHEEQIIASEQLANFFEQGERKVVGRGADAIVQFTDEFEAKIKKDGFDAIIEADEILGYNMRNEPVRFRASSSDSQALFRGILADGSVELLQKTPLRGGSKLSIQGHKAIIAGLFGDHLRPYFGDVDLIFLPKTWGRQEQHLHATGMINEFLHQNRFRLSDPAKRAELIQRMGEHGIKLEGEGIGFDTRYRYRDEQGKEHYMPLAYVDPSQKVDVTTIERFLEGENLPEGFVPIKVHHNVAGRSIEMGRLEARMLRQEETMRLTRPDNMTTGGYIDPKRPTAVSMGIRELQYMYLNEQPGMERYFESVREIQSYLLDGKAWSEVIDENRQLRRAWEHTFDPSKAPGLEVVSIDEFKPLPDGQIASKHLKGTILDPHQKSAFVLDLGEDLGLSESSRYIAIAPDRLSSYYDATGRSMPVVDPNGRRANLRALMGAVDDLRAHQYQSKHDLKFDKRKRDEKISQVEKMVEKYNKGLYWDYDDAYGQVFSSGRVNLPGSAYARVHTLNAELDEPTVIISRKMGRDLGLDPSSSEAQYAILGANPSDRSSVQFARVQFMDDDQLGENQMILTKSLALAVGRDADGDQAWIHTLTSNYEEMAKKAINERSQGKASNRIVSERNKEILRSARRADKERETLLAQLTSERQEQLQSGTLKYIGVREEEMAGLTRENDLTKQSARDLIDEARRRVFEMEEGRTIAVGGRLYDQALANMLSQDATGVMRNIELKMLQVASEFWEPGDERLEILKATMDTMTQAAISGKKGESTINLGQMVTEEHVRNIESARRDFGHETRAGVLMYHAFSKGDLDQVQNILTEIAALKDNLDPSQVTSDLSINNIKISEMMGVLREVATESDRRGIKWNDLSLLVSASKGVDGRRINQASRRELHSIARLQQMRLTGESEEVIAAFMQRQADIRKITQNRSPRLTAPTPISGLKRAAAETGMSLAAAVPFMALSAAFGAILPKMLSSSPLSIDQRPQHDMAPGMDGSYSVLQNPNAFGQTMPTQIQVMSNQSGHQGIQVRISARDFAGMDPNELSTIVASSIQQSANMRMNVNVNINDNTNSLKEKDLENFLINLL